MATTPTLEHSIARLDATIAEEQKRQEFRDMLRKLSVLRDGTVMGISGGGAGDRLNYWVEVQSTDGRCWSLTVTDMREVESE